MSSPDDFFTSAFPPLSDGNAPFPWQRRLFRDMLQGDWPKSCNLPTGVGKTSVIPIWLLALVASEQANPGSNRVPRRLAYVVNRRTVVDQATSEAEKIRAQITQPQDDLPPHQRLVLRQIHETLDRLSGGIGEVPLVVSTLRGQFADNGEWRNNPARPAIVVGTVDMIGSRLLFSGYGLGFKTKPLHAGLLGQDTLLIHDEAHLEPAFQELILAIEADQRPNPMRGHPGEPNPLRVLELTATTRGNAPDATFLLSNEDLNDEVVGRRLAARKTIHLSEINDEKTTADSVAERALTHADSQQAILIYLRRLDDVEKVAERLTKSKLSLELLTGTIRGLERDRLATEDPIFARFLPPSSRAKNVTPHPGTVFLICTSAGEVGVNLSADQLVCDLTPFESMAQRFGRVNRFGEGDARLDVVHPSFARKEGKENDQPNALELARERTLGLLRRLPPSGEGFDASPLALGELPPEERQAAYSPPPTIPAVDEILFDAWALTSIREPLPGRPPVADWLHGIREDEPPESFVAWREEVDRLPNANPKLAQELLEDYPLKPHELLRGASYRVFDRLKKLARKLDDNAPDPRVWLISADDSVVIKTLRELVKEDKGAIDGLTVVLPPSLGGLNQQGMFGEGTLATQLDVADEWRDSDGKPRRLRYLGDEPAPRGMRLVREIDLDPLRDDEGGDEEEASARIWRWYTRPRSADDDGSMTAVQQQLLDVHQRAAGDFASRLVKALALPSPLADAVVLAARHHDEGKNRAVWQAAIGNRDPKVVLAKSGNRLPLVNLSNYRHEFGSLREVEDLPEFQAHAVPEQDLILHLIGAHHGRARPHFPEDEAFDPQSSDDISARLALGVVRRYARLQRAHGRWRLAWLESLVRASDYLASDAQGDVS